MTALLGLATRLGLARLMLITGTRSEVGDLAEFIDAGFAGGVDLVQLRDPDADPDTLLAALRVLRDVGYRYQGLVSVYESGALAEKFQADLLHLSERGEKAAAARGHLHKWGLIGRSCHSRAQIEVAVADPDVNYLTVGPVYGGLPVGDAGLGLIQHAAKVAPPSDPKSKPWFAVGGITAANLDEVIAAGARRIAVSRAITDADDPEAAAMALKDRLRHVWNEDPAMQGLTLKLFQN
ncbi:MAG: thiamine phosphate synthase [Propionibacteriaceae bacterium]|nr:thiamine phosphate synthase [Propionibacteriaceae bacterium]